MDKSTNRKFQKHDGMTTSSIYSWRKKNMVDQDIPEKRAVSSRFHQGSVSVPQLFVKLFCNMFGDDTNMLENCSEEYGQVRTVDWADRNCMLLNALPLTILF